MSGSERERWPAAKALGNTWPALVAEFSRAAKLTAGAGEVRRTLAIVKAYVWTDPAAAEGNVTAAGIERYLAGLVERGRSPKTIRNHRAALSRFCRFLINRGLLATNPCHSVSVRRPEELLPRWLDDAEIRQVLDIARIRRIWPEVCLALSTGLRLSELIRLRWEDIDFGRRCLTVRKSKARRPRIVPLSRSALVALRMQRRQAGQLSFVFPSRRTCRACQRFVDKPRAINWWGRALKPIKDAVPKFNALPGKSTGRGWHLFRHTFASRAIQGRDGRPGVSLFRLSRWLGHGHLQTTRIYAHLQEGWDEQIEAASPL